MSKAPVLGLWGHELINCTKSGIALPFRNKRSTLPIVQMLNRKQNYKNVIYHGKL